MPHGNPRRTREYWRWYSRGKSDALFFGIASREVEHPDADALRDPVLAKAYSDGVAAVRTLWKQVNEKLSDAIEAAVEE